MVKFSHKKREASFHFLLIFMSYSGSILFTILRTHSRCVPYTLFTHFCCVNSCKYV
nr:MAG TPA: hypothetical protein [Caudoviricetes sp.]DAI50696.1 MAG TPA: hypothetical protein [Bacteriophage sp.]